MIVLRREMKEKVERYLKEPTQEEIKKRKEFMDGVVERVAKRSIRKDGLISKHN